LSFIMCMTAAAFLVTFFYDGANLELAMNFLFECHSSRPQPS
jgi:hypothetical protein